MSHSSIPLLHSLRGRLLLFIILPVILVVVGERLWSAYETVDGIRDEAEKSLRYLADEVAAEVERGNTRAVLTARMLALSQEEVLFGDREASSALARRVLEEFPEFTGAYIGYEPDADGKDASYVEGALAKTVGPAFGTGGRFLPYWFRDAASNGAIKLTPLVDMEKSLYYDGCREQAAEANCAVPMVTEPYVYEGKMIVEQTFPIFREGRFVGVAGVDRALKDIATFLEGIQEDLGVDVFLISSRGRFIASTVADETLRTNAIEETPYAALFQPIYEGRRQQAFQIADDPLVASPHYFASARVPTGDWMVVLREAEADVLGPILSRVRTTSLLALSAILAVAALAWWLSSRASRRIEEAMHAADRVASGDLPESMDEHYEGKDEIASMFRSLGRVVESYKQVGDVCTAIAGGDYSRRVDARSEGDELAAAINVMADRRQEAEQQVEAYTSRLESRTEELERLSAESAQRAAIEVQHAALSTRLQGDLDVADTAQRALDSIVQFVEAPMAAIYSMMSDGRLHRIASHAYPDGEADAPSLALGEGTVGEAARTRRTLTAEPEGDTLRIRFGFGDLTPTRIVAVPLMANDVVTGVLELCLLKPLSPTHQRWLEKASETSAAALRFAIESDERKEAEERTRLLLESSAEGVFGVDTEGRVTFVNPAACRMLGYEPKDLLGKASHALIHHSRADGSPYPVKDCPMYAAYTEGRTSRVDDECLWRGDGEGVPVEYGAVPMRKDGEIVGAVITFADIADRKRTQAALAEAKSKAEEATELKSMFLANMSHEIRTPMNAIIGLAHLALKTDLTPKQRDYVAKVHNAGTSLLGVINDILDFSKIEAGQLDIESTPFHLDDMISSVASVTSLKAHEKNLELVVAVPPEVPTDLVGDPLRLGQVLTNLIGNAVKFTETGDIRVTTEVLEQTGDKVKLQFAVRDTGMGMTKEQAGRLFKPFSQADMSTTRKHGGTGLGLSISRRLVELMGGQIWAESEPGVGSTFRFTVWLGVGSPSERRTGPPPIVRNLRLLVVDDNPAAREILVDALESVSPRVDAVASGPEAIAQIRAQAAADPYDVVFMDWRMPGMDGLEAIRAVKSDETLPTAPHMVVCTAFGREEVRAEAESLDVDGFILKPVTRSTLLDSLVTIYAPETTLEAAASAQDASEAARLQGAHLLLVEDNEINQQVATELLEGAGATVDVVSNGRIAVEALLACPADALPDLVLMDLQMPEMDGFQATAKIRDEPSLAHLAIVAMTAHATQEERERCLAAGMQDHIAKPIDPAVLYDTVARYVADAHASRAKRGDASPGSAAPHTTSAPTTKSASTVLDTADGLLRVAGNETLYRKLLAQLEREQMGAARAITAALTDPGKGVAERLAHSLKGAAGNLGAREVHELAGEVERAIADDRDEGDLHASLARLGAALERLHEAVRAYLGPDARQDPVPTPDVPGSEAPWADTAARMKSLLADFDASATELLAQHDALFRARLGPEGFATFERLVQAYAFSDASNLLDTVSGASDPEPPAEPA